jgi:hypothetical protein
LWVDRHKKCTKSPYPGRVNRSVSSTLRARLRISNSFDTGSNFKLLPGYGR